MTDHGFEDFLRTSLDGAVAAAGSPPPLPRRRVRVRQAVLMGAAGAIVVLGAFGVVSAAGGLVADEGIAPAVPPGELMDERGSGGTYPCSLTAPGPNRPSGSCIAAGERGDLGWKLGASLETTGDLCLILETVGGPGAGGAGAGCNEHEPGSIGLEQMGVEGLPLLAYGHVPPAARSLVLEHGASESFELEIYPAPAGFGADLGFYLVWLPDDAVRLVAYDSAGEVVAARPLAGAPSEGDTGPTEYVEVGSGTYRGVSWSHEAYGIVEDGRDIVCTRTLVGPALSSPLAPCDASYGRDSIVGITPHTSRDALPGYTALGGVTSSTTGSVTFVTGAREVEATMIDAPPRIEQTLRFFVAFVPADSDDGTVSATVIVRDRSGRVVEERDVCVRRGASISC